MVELVIMLMVKPELLVVTQYLEPLLQPAVEVVGLIVPPDLLEALEAEVEQKME
jgi:hypothetical protein